MSEDVEVKSTESIIAEYDYRIEQLIQKRNRLTSERDSLRKKNNQNSDGYDATIKAKNDLSSIFGDIASYAKSAGQKVDRKVKIMRELFDYIETTSQGPKINNQFENLNSMMRSISKAFDVNETIISNLNSQIDSVNSEIERLRSLKGSVLNG